MKKRSLIAKLGIPFLSAAVIAPVVMSPAQAAPGDIQIGVITATSGGLKSYGDAFVDGFEWGLKYYTQGKMTVNGKKLVVTKKDDAGDPTAATAAFKDMVGNGTKIIVGTASSAVALTLAPLAQQNKVLYISGPAKNDAITSAANKYVFRSGNTSTQDLAPLSGLKGVKGKTIVLFVEDNAFGAGNILAAKALIGPKGANFVEIKVPTSTSDFTPFAKQALDAKGSHIFIAWSNALTSGAMLGALKVQGVFSKSIPITGLAGVSSYDIYGTLFDGSNAILTSSFFPNVTGNAVATKLANDFAAAGKSQDLFTCTGVDAAKMVVEAVKNNPNVDVDKAIAKLENLSWLGIKGIMKVNARNHTLTQPMFLVGLNKSGSKYVPSLIRTINNVTA
jgi:branched-chain amino acid transport system substrate-binding protein